eukprot:1159113-Pelagomonas_calceolata.AAC.12
MKCHAMPGPQTTGTTLHSPDIIHASVQYLAPLCRCLHHSISIPRTLRATGPVAFCKPLLAHTPTHAAAAAAARCCMPLPCGDDMP